MAKISTPKKLPVLWSLSDVKVCLLTHNAAKEPHKWMSLDRDLKCSECFHWFRPPPTLSSEGCSREGVTEGCWRCRHGNIHHYTTDLIVGHSVSVDCKSRGLHQLSFYTTSPGTSFSACLWAHSCPLYNPKKWVGLPNLLWPNRREVQSCWLSLCEIQKPTV